MAQAGYTPIQLYYSTTASATPSAGNLANGELAINITDGRLFYKDNGGTVRVLAGTGGSGVVAGSNTQVQFNNNGVFGASSGLTFDGTTLTANALTITNATTLSAGTANGVAYLNGSKVLTTGSALTFDGTNLGVGTASPQVATGYSTINANGTNGGIYNLMVGGTRTGTFYTNGSTDVRLGTATTAPLLFLINFEEQMRLTSTGLGIGTSSPAGKLDVVGTADQIRAGNGTVTAFLGGSGSNGYTGTLTNHSFLFYTNSAERMRLDSSGNVGIGTNSPGAKLDVAGTSRIRTDVSSATVIATATNAAANAYATYRIDSNDYQFYTTGSEKMRIDSSGNLLVGTTSADAKFVAAHGLNNVVGRIAQTASSGITTDIFQVTALNHATSTSLFMLRCYTSGPSAQFAVRSDGVVYAQNTAIQSISDARVKENVRNSEEGLQTVLGLRPVRFDFKEGFGNNRKNQLGFIAQEVEAVFPDAVDAAGEEDEQGEPYKSVGPGAMIPVLVKAIQEQQAIIQSLTARVAALEAA